MTSTQQQSPFEPDWTLGDRLRKARHHTGMTVADFAEHIGVSDRTINNAEGDKRSVRPITIKAWALATGVSEDWIRTGARRTDAPPPVDPSGLDALTEKKMRRTSSTTRQYGSRALAGVA